VLTRARIGRLACVREDQPYVVPVHVSFDGRDLYGLSTVGQKVEWMRENPRVCVEVEEFKNPRRWTTVLVFGRYEELTRSRAHERARARAEELLSRRVDYWLPAAAKVLSHEHHAPVMYRIVVSRMTGRRADSPPR
jgi:nitroimidazol reductase NimA-like FMN-containing flavoprotein (pyridoxamine 5'-phosphate oxidase superfamily)